MNAPSSALGQGAYSTLPPSFGERLGKLLYWPAVAALIVGALYLVFAVYTAGQASWAAGLLVLFTAGFYVYVSRGGFAWRYLFPGVAGMLVFIAFPLVYTAQIGFTNYSSTHLLSESRVREYLLEQHDAVEAQVLAYSLHASGDEYRLVLQADGDAAPRWVSPLLALRSGKPLHVDLAAADAATSTGTALPLPDVIKHRDALSQLVLTLPDKTELHYLGLREFGPVKPQWTANADGSLTLFTSLMPASHG